MCVGMDIHANMDFEDCRKVLHQLCSGKLKIVQHMKLPEYSFNAHLQSSINSHFVFVIFFFSRISEIIYINIYKCHNYLPLVKCFSIIYITSQWKECFQNQISMFVYHLAEVLDDFTMIFVKFCSICIIDKMVQDNKGHFQPLRHIADISWFVKCCAEII